MWSKNYKMKKTGLPKCPSCGHDLIFSPKHQNLFCEQCGSVLNFEKKLTAQKKDFIAYANQQNLKNDWSKESQILKCENCGGRVVLNSLEYSGICPYCGGSCVTEVNGISGMKPDTIIPFAFDQEEAKKIFKKKCNSKIFLPSGFKKNIPTSKVIGLYIPSFVYDADTESNYVGTLIKNEHYEINGNSRTREIVIPIRGNISLKHQNVIVEASSKITQENLLSILPYDENKQYNFDENFIRGYVVEVYDEDFINCHKHAIKTFDNNIRNAVLSRYEYDNVSRLNIQTNYYNERFIYRISPVYVFEFDFKSKHYISYMNGQTGKVGSGLPVSSYKIFALVLISLILIAGIVLLFTIL